MKENREMILEALNSVERFERVTTAFPQDFSRMPCATVDERKVATVWADDEPYMWGYSYNIDVWAKTSYEALELAHLAERALLEAGFMPESMEEVAFEEHTKVRLMFSS